MGNATITPKRILTFAGIFAVAAAFRLYTLDELPGEWYSDISIVDQYVSQILDFQWPFEYDASAGPLYHYLIAPFIAIFGRSYLTYKLASVAMSILGIAVAVLLAYEIGGLRLSYLTGLVSGISSWLLVFSRLGNSQVISPILTGLAGYFLMRFARRRETSDAFLGALVAALGLYTYPQTFILPFVFLLFLTIFTFRRRFAAFSRTVLHPRSLLTGASPDSPGSSPGAPLLDATSPPAQTGNHVEACVVFFRPLQVGIFVTVMIALPFVAIAVHQPDNFRTGYLGDKIFGAEPAPIQSTALAFAQNLAKSTAMLHFRGDYVFRSNPPFLPHLDAFSGLILFLGIGGLAGRRRWRALGFILASIFLLVVPGSWPYIPSGEIPSASRTLGITPFVYLLVAYGLLVLYDLLKKVPRRKADSKSPRVWATLVVGLALASIAVLNAQRYFVIYAWNLPDHNVAFGRIIAQKMDTLPGEAEVFIGGSQWGAWGQPDFDAIVHQLRAPRTLTDLPPHRFTCDQLGSSDTPKYFFWDPRDKVDGFTRLRECLPGGQIEERISEYGATIYLLYYIGPRSPSTTPPTLPRQRRGSTPPA